MTDSIDNPYPRLERIFHEPGRLTIMSNLLGAPDGMTFTELKKACGLTDGNLSRHLKVLENAKAVTIKKRFVGWTGPDVYKIGADENGLTLIEVTGSWATSTSTGNYGRIVTYTWADIEDVSVRAAFGGILLFGCVDPTLSSCVRLKFKDGTSKDIKPPTSLMFIAPLWIASSEWSKAHKLGKVFQTVVDSHKQDPSHGAK